MLSPNFYALFLLLFLYFTRNFCLNPLLFSDSFIIFKMFLIISFQMVQNTRFKLTPLLTISQGCRFFQFPDSAIFHVTLAILLLLLRLLLTPVQFLNRTIAKRYKLFNISGIILQNGLRPQPKSARRSAVPLASRSLCGAPR